MAIISFYNDFFDLKAYNSFCVPLKFLWYVIKLFYDLGYIYDEFFDYDFSVLWKKRVSIVLIVVLVVIFRLSFIRILFSLL